MSRDAGGGFAWVSACQSCLASAGALRLNDIRRGATEGARALKSPKAPRECAHILGHGCGHYGLNFRLGACGTERGNARHRSGKLQAPIGVRL